MQGREITFQTPLGMIIHHVLSDIESAYSFSAQSSMLSGSLVGVIKTDSPSVMGPFVFLALWPGKGMETKVLLPPGII
jgi:hypothetical protein